MNDPDQPPAAHSNRWPTVAFVGIFLILSGAGGIHHGIETIDWPFKVGWIDYFNIGRPQIVAEALQIIVGVALLIYAVVKGRFRFSLRDLLWTVTLVCFGLWLLASFREVNEHPFWFFLAFIACTAMFTIAAGMYSARRRSRNP